MPKKLIKDWRPMTVGAIIVAIVGGSLAGLNHYHHSPVHRPAALTSKTLRRRPAVLNRASTASLGSTHLLTAKKQPKMSKAKAVVVMNAENGHVIYAKNPDQPRKVASLGKLMTLYLAARKATYEKAWNQKVSQADGRQLRRLSYDKTGLGGFKFKKGHQYTVGELYQAALIESSNNAAIALGEWTAGSNQDFIKMMNKQAQLWSIKAHFVSSSGLENDDISKYHLHVSGGRQAGNEVSARALSIIAYHLIHQYPQVLQWSKLASKKVDGQNLDNADNLLKGKYEYRPGLNVDGLKTGFTNRAGMCYVGTEKPAHGPRIITVVLHDGNDFQDTADLMQWINKQMKGKV